jgi:dihydropyrimidinase
MWAGLQTGGLDFVVTDHCPFTLAQKSGKRRMPEFRRLPDNSSEADAAGLRKLENAPEEPWANGLPAFNQVPGGAPGIETRLPLVYHFGVNEGRLSLSEFVNLTSTAAARLYGLYPRKGTLAPGADADIVLFDPGREVTITAEGLHQNCDYTPYEGMRVTGWPTMVLSRGEVIVREGRFVGRAGRGEYLKRAA